MTLEYEHKTKADGLRREINSGKSTIDKLEHEKDGLARDLGWERHWRRKDAISWNSQVDQAQSLNNNDYQIGWSLAKKRAKQCKVLETTNLEQQQQQKRTLDKAQKELAETKCILDNQKQQACEQHDHTIAGLQETKRDLNKKMKAKEAEVNNIKSEALREFEKVKAEAAREVEGIKAEARSEINKEREQKHSLQRSLTSKSHSTMLVC